MRLTPAVLVELQPDGARRLLEPVRQTELANIAPLVLGLTPHQESGGLKPKPPGCLEVSEVQISVLMLGSPSSDWAQPQEINTLRCLSSGFRLSTCPWAGATLQTLLAQGVKRWDPD